MEQNKVNLVEIDWQIQYTNSTVVAAKKRKHNIFFAHTKKIHSFFLFAFLIYVTMCLLVSYKSEEMSEGKKFTRQTKRLFYAQAPSYVHYAYDDDGARVSAEPKLTYTLLYKEKRETQNYV